MELFEGKFEILFVLKIQLAVLDVASHDRFQQFVDQFSQSDFHFEPVGMTINNFLIRRLLQPSDRFLVQMSDHLCPGLPIIFLFGIVTVIQVLIRSSLVLHLALFAYESLFFFQLLLVFFDLLINLLSLFFGVPHPLLSFGPYCRIVRKSAGLRLLLRDSIRRVLLRRAGGHFPGWRTACRQLIRHICKMIKSYKL